MTYYKASQYKERWFVRFKDLLNADWRISIEDPTFVGVPTEITGASEPFSWTGQGDEKQDTCVSGSTGYLRIVVEDETAIDGIRPTELNSRRVTARRDGVLVWQGFLQMQEYSQDWIAAPYELELPIVSPLELAKDMPLPDYNANISKKRYYNTIIPYMVELLGIDTECLITNYQAHIGINGTATTFFDQWVNAVCNIEFFYTFGNNEITPKKVYDVLETIFYPWGRLCERGNMWYAITYDRTCKLLYKFSFADYEDGLVAYVDDEGTQKSYEEMNLASLDICSTDNTRSYIAAPNSVTFKLGVETNDSILSLADDMIAPTFTCVYDNLQVSEKDDEIRYLCGMTANYNGRFSMEGGLFVRVMSREDTEHDNNVTTYEFNDIIPLGIMVYSTQNCVITPNELVLTKIGFNHIKQTLRVYDANGWEVDDDTDLVINDLPLTDTANGFVRDGSSFTRYVWANDISYTPSALSLTIKSSDKTYIIVPTFEYVKVADNNQDAIVGEFLSGIAEHNFYRQGNGSGDALTITFKTLCGGLTEARSNISVPHGGFNDSMELIDMHPRYMLDLSAVRPADPLALVLDPILVRDGALRYIPVAVGMNARDCTTELKLVSSNSGQKDANLKWTPNTATYDTASGTPFRRPTFASATTATISFYSSNEAVATVNSDGVISLTETVGVALITAKSPANDDYRAGEASVAITVVDSSTEKQEAGLAWSGAERITFDYADGEDFVSPTFSKDTDADVTFTSDDEEVATVDEDGVITLNSTKTVGRARFTAASPETDEYEAGEAHLQITVKDSGKTLRLDYAGAKAVQLVGVKGWSADDTNTYFLTHGDETKTFTASDVLNATTFTFSDVVDKYNWETNEGITLIVNID